MNEMTRRKERGGATSLTVGKSRGDGFTFIVLWVAIAIIGMLCGLLRPAIQAARERRATARLADALLRRNA